MLWHTIAGTLANGVSLPSHGANFQSYSFLGHLLRRTYVHSAVYVIIVDTYRELERQMPEKTFVYGETGWPEGGQFKPHKTHQNGLAVDFMVPVTDSSGKSIPIPGSVLNQFGYDIEFDERGDHPEYIIDFESMAAHLAILHEQSIMRGYDLKLVIFDLKLQAYLFKTKRGDYLKRNLRFSTKRAWIRHDEHYHVVFDVPCKPL